MFTSRISSRLVVLAAGGALTAGALSLGSTPAGAALSAQPTGTYAAGLTPYISTVTGTTTLTRQSSRWLGSARLNGLTPGNHYQYEVSVAEHYVNGQAVGWNVFPVCSFVATSVKGGCSASNLNIEGRTALTAQSGAVVYSPEAHTSIATGEFSYLAALAPYLQLSRGGSASVGFDTTSQRWTGRVNVSGLTPGSTYTWGVDVVEAYDSSGNPVSFHRIVLCQFTATGTGQIGCATHGRFIEGRSDLPAGSSTDVASFTSVAFGTLY